MKKGDTYKKVRARYMAMLRRYRKAEGQEILTYSGKKVLPPASTYEAMITGETKQARAAQMERAMREMKTWQRMRKSSPAYERRAMRSQSWDNFVSRTLSRVETKINEQAYSVSDALTRERQRALENVESDLNDMSESAKIRGGRLLENDMQSENHLTSLIENSILPSDQETRDSFYRALQQAIAVLEKVSIKAAKEVRELVLSISETEDWTEENL